MNLLSKKTNNEKGAIGLIAVILLILGIIVGVFLVQTRTNLLPKAFDSVSAPVTSPDPSAAPAARRVFVTSKKYTGNLGGLSGADAKCQAAATDASLGGNWKAWVSTTNTASSRLEHSTGQYKLLNGKVVANSWTDLTDGILQNQIDVTELGQAYPNLTDKIWTGTTYNGGLTPLATNLRNCLDWTNETTTSSGGTGTFNMYGSWSDNGGYNNCATLQPIYCFEQAPTSSGNPQGTATLKLVPNKTASVGDTVQMSLVAVSPNDPINLYSAQLTFPLDKVEVTDITVDTTNFNNTFEKYFTVAPSGTGEISIIMGNSTAVNLPQSTSAGQVVATITFKTKSSGQADIAFTSKSKIYRASDGVNIFNQSSAVNGQILVQGTPIQTPTPPVQTPNPSQTPVPPFQTPTPTQTPFPTPNQTPTTLGPCTITKAEWSVPNGNTNQWIAPTTPVQSNTNAALNVETSGACFDKEVQFILFEDDGVLGTDQVKITPSPVALTATAGTNNYVIKSIWLTEFQEDGFFGANNPPEYKFTVWLTGSNNANSGFVSTNQLQVLAQAGTPTFVEGDLNRSGGKPDLGDLSWLLRNLYQPIKDELVDYDDNGIINNLDRSHLVYILQTYGELRSTNAP